jgi:hypothetical protein
VLQQGPNEPSCVTSASQAHGWYAGAEACGSTFGVGWCALSSSV